MSDQTETVECNQHGLSYTAFVCRHLAKGSDLGFFCDDTSDEKVSWSDFDLVFPSEIGTALNPSNVTRAFKKILEKAELRTSIRLYDLRHTTATLLLQAGINPKVVSERLGHSTVVLTLDVYSHVLPNMQIEATTQLEQIFFNKVLVKN